MRALPARLFSAVSDMTIGTAIVLVHSVLADRTRRVRDGTPIDDPPSTDEHQRSRAAARSHRRA